MFSEVLDRVGTARDLIKAGENPAVHNSFYDGDAGNTIVMEQRPYFDHDRQPVYIRNMVWDNGGNDIVSTGPGDDWMIAGSGADSYDGGADFDIVAYLRAGTAVKVDLADTNGTSAFRETNASSFAFGDRFEDVEGLVGSKFGDTLRGHFDEGSYINGFDGNDSITGGRGVDTLKGGNGGDSINAIGGHGDQVFGGAGADRITVGSDSTISGGLGSDLFIFNFGRYLGAGGEALGELVITDWNVGGEGDSLQIRGLTTASGLHIEQDGADLTITFDGVGGEIRFLDTSAQELLQSISLV